MSDITKVLSEDEPWEEVFVCTCVCEKNRVHLPEESVRCEDSLSYINPHHVRKGGGGGGRGC